MAINYPVDTNARWAFYNTSTQEILRHNVHWPRSDGMEIVGLDPDIVPLLEVYEAQPAFDSATQTAERASPVVDVDANTHTHGWAVRDLTQEELDAKAAQDQHNSNRDQAKAVYQDLKNGVGTSTERLVRIERVCSFLLKDRFYDEI